MSADCLRPADLRCVNEAIAHLTEVDADEIRWTLQPVDPLTRCEDDWRADAIIFRTLFLLALDRLMPMTNQLDAARQTIRQQGRKRR